MGRGRAHHTAAAGAVATGRAPRPVAAPARATGPPLPAPASRAGTGHDAGRRFLTGSGGFTGARALAECLPMHRKLSRRIRRQLPQDGYEIFTGDEGAVVTLRVVCEQRKEGTVPHIIVTADHE